MQVFQIPHTPMQPTRTYPTPVTPPMVTPGAWNTAGTAYPYPSRTTMPTGAWAPQASLPPMAPAYAQQAAYSYYPAVSPSPSAAAPLASPPTSYDDPSRRKVEEMAARPTEELLSENLSKLGDTLTRRYPGWLQPHYVQNLLSPESIQTFIQHPDQLDDAAMELAAKSPVGTWFRGIPKAARALLVKLALWVSPAPADAKVDEFFRHLERPV